MRTRRCVRGVVLALAALAAAAGPFAGPLAAQRSLVFERFDADIAVRQNGDVVVRETLQPHFTGSWNGIVRVLSLQHTTAKHKRARLNVDFQSATDGQGHALRHEIEHPDRWHERFRVWVPGAANATRTVVLTYVVHNAIRFFEPDSTGAALDELYWQVTGTEWEVPIRVASATVMLPRGLAVKQAAAYGGAVNSTAQVPVEVEGGVARVTDAGPFTPGHGLTIAVGWPAGTVARPTAADALRSGFGTYWPLLLPLLVFYFAYRRWNRNGRDPKPHSIMVRYDPPHDLRPVELGTLVDNRADMRDITSMIVDLAVRGHIRIDELEKEGLLAKLKEQDYEFHLLKPPSEWQGLEPYEHVFLTSLFSRDHVDHVSLGRALATVMGSGAPHDDARKDWPDPLTVPTIKLSDLKNSFYKKVSSITNAVYDRLVDRAFYRTRPDKAMRLWLGMAVPAVGIGVAIAVVSQSAGAVGARTMLGVALAVSGVILAIFGIIMPARTETGARTREEALGFKEFLAKVDADRFKRMITSPKMFEQFLAYAMAFHVEEKWAKAFDGMFTEPPDWYRSSAGMHAGVFNASMFAHSLSSMTTQASSTMSSSPSSGSGGGGSVGGGSGGGGGGGF
ncbi:MAG: DUF2207 domain-containing protein [Gemmatimonadota bacterium]|jgi:uncharacterized membrane protein YgcG